MKKCPICNQIHRSQKTAQRCYQEARAPVDHKIISGASITPEEQAMLDKMKSFFFNLPLPKKPITKGGNHE